MFIGSNGIISDGTLHIICPAGKFSGSFDTLYHEIPFKASIKGGPYLWATISGRFEQINNETIVAFLNVALAKDNNQIIAEFELRMRKSP